MSNILNSEDFGLKIYNRFPPKYREDDSMQDYALKRYLQSLSDGGFKYSIDEINGITDLIDPDKVDSKVLPILFKQYGLEIFNGIPEQYLRYLLPKLGEAWSKKGSLSVVEFITSSLSGIKTSTDVLYDDDGNPTIGVRLEMDYNLGDYFPEAEQFTRLLKNFVPFYSDVIMLYSYLFYETQVLVGKEKYLMNIHDIKGDSGVLKFGESNVIKNIIKQTLLESSVISKVGDSEINEISLAIVHEEPKIRIGEYNIGEKPKTFYSDSASFSLTRRDQSATEKSAVFGEAIMGLSVFGSSEYLDTHKDFITDTKLEVGTFNNPVDTLLNKEYNTLNGGFYTNGLYCYDIITIGEITEVVY